MEVNRVTLSDKNSNFNRPAKITVYGEIMDISGVKQLQIDFELILNEGKENG
ncbi:hypothetical protein [Paenibacillus sp. Soil750]|uniref:hypothetical protein n=1 Tax=Paenibacillus sp. Soil750 TaxID=1736398 RepID=UPI000A8154C9|nr:hypothetical protein [Paenibacillus sp. Soil750]